MKSTGDLQCGCGNDRQVVDANAKNFADLLNESNQLVKEEEERYKAEHEKLVAKYDETGVYVEKGNIHTFYDKEDDMYAFALEYTDDIPHGEPALYFTTSLEEIQDLYEVLKYILGK